MADSYYLFPNMGSESTLSKSLSSQRSTAGGGGGPGVSGTVGGGGDRASNLLVTGSLALAAAASFAYVGVRYASMRLNRSRARSRSPARRASTPPVLPAGGGGGHRPGSRMSTPNRNAHNLAQQVAAIYAGTGDHHDTDDGDRAAVAAPGGGGDRRVRPAPLARSPSRDSGLGASTNPVASSKWTKGPRLGGGTFGEVYLGRHAKTGQMAAIKEMKRVEDEKECLKEFSLLKGLRHPFVVAVYGVEVDRPHSASGSSDSPDRGSGALRRSHHQPPGDDVAHMRLVLEYCPNGSLSDVLRRDGPCGEALLRSYARQILLGLSFLHQHNILHRDIKPANILISASGRLKLTDFGMSRHLDTMHTRTSLAGSPAYMSPEAIEGRYYVGTDLWAVGATLTQLATGQSPWSHVKDRDLRHPNALMHYICCGPLSLSSPKEEIAAALKDHHPALPSWISDAGRVFLKQLFAFDHRERGSCAELLRHPWIVNGGPSPVTESTCFTFVGDDGADSDEEEAGHALGGMGGQADTADSTDADGSRRHQQQQATTVMTAKGPVDPLDLEISTTTGGSSSRTRTTKSKGSSKEGNSSNATLQTVSASGPPHEHTHTQPGGAPPTKGDDADADAAAVVLVSETPSPADVGPMMPHNGGGHTSDGSLQHHRSLPSNTSSIAAAAA